MEKEISWDVYFYFVYDRFILERHEPPTMEDARMEGEKFRSKHLIGARFIEELAEEYYHLHIDRGWPSSGTKDFFIWRDNGEFVGAYKVRMEQVYTVLWESGGTLWQG